MGERSKLCRTGDVTTTITQGATTTIILVIGITVAMVVMATATVVAGPVVMVAVVIQHGITKMVATTNLVGGS